MGYRLDHIALLVRDLDASVAFLTDVLGLVETPNPMGGTAIRWIDIGDGRRFHVQAGDVSRVHVEKQTHFALSASDFDAVLIATDHDAVDYAALAAWAPIIVDTRNAFGRRSLAGANVVKA